MPQLLALSPRQVRRSSIQFVQLGPVDGLGCRGASGTMDCFNIFNQTKTEGPLSVILSDGPGTINGTNAYFTSVGAGSGSFSSGQPRAF